MGTRSTRNRINKKSRANLRNTSNVGRAASRVRPHPSPSPSRPARTKAKTRRNRAHLIPAIVLILVLITGGGTIYISFKSPSREESRKVIEQFQVACNELKITEIVRCMEPSLRDSLVVQGAAILGDEILEEVLDTLGSGIGLISGEEDMDLTEVFETLKLEPKKYGWPRRTRCVKCKASFVGITKSVKIYVRKEDGEVYIEKVEV